METRIVKIATLVFDYDMYPRGRLDTHLGREYATAMQAGAVFPPIIVCADTTKVIDGFKRCRARQLLFGDDAEIEAVFKRYRNDGERFEEAMRSAATQGERLTTSDLVRCAILAKKFKLPIKVTARALQLKPRSFLDLVEERTATSKTSGQDVALKSTVAEMWRGKKLTAEQEEENRKLVGMRPMYFINRLIGLIKNDGLDTENEQLMDRLEELGKLIRKMLAAK